jgi:hypothetical protein
MADASRFPRLAPPFAIVGACAGWLSGGALANPILHQLDRALQPLAAILACLFAAIVGGLLRRWCAGRRYDYQLTPPDPSTRLPTDVGWRHAIAMISAGTLTGMLIGANFGSDEGMRGGLAGTVCAILFLPIGFAVLGSARRAQRARLGSIVAASDRRAVWGILAATLGVATIEAAPEWAGFAEPPRAAAVMLFASCCAVTFIAVLDVRAHRALALVVSDLEARPDFASAPERIDLGVGDDLAARLERSTSPYRGSDRTLALVHGDPRLARAALKRAVVRGAISMVLLGATLAVHLAANMEWADDLAVRLTDPPHCHPYTLR